MAEPNTPAPKAQVPGGAAPVSRKDFFAAHVAAALINRNGLTFSSTTSVAKTVAQFTDDLMRELDAQK